MVNVNLGSRVNIEDPEHSTSVATRARPGSGMTLSSSYSRRLETESFRRRPFDALSELIIMIGTRSALAAANGKPSLAGSPARSL